MLKTEMMAAERIFANRKQALAELEKVGLCQSVAGKHSWLPDSAVVVFRRPVPRLRRARQVGEGGPGNNRAVGRGERSGRQGSAGHDEQRRHRESRGQEEGGAQTDGQDGGKQVSCDADAGAVLFVFFVFF